MMELCMDFDDSLFEGEKVRSVDSATSLYKAKVYSSEWFESELEDGDAAEQHNVYKYRAELAYRKELYEDSLRCYGNCLGLISAKNSVTWRDVIEGMCRCCLALGKDEQATSLAKQLHDSSITFEQKTSSWMLLAKVYRHMANLQEEEQILQVLLMMHPINPGFWLRLGVIHSSISGRQCATGQHHARTDAAGNTVPETGDNVNGDNHFDSVDDTLYKENHEKAVFSDTSSQHLQFACACLQRARLLLRSVQNTVVTFDKSCNVTQQQEIAEKIKQLNLPETTMQQYAEMTEKEVFKRKEKPDGGFRDGHCRHECTS
ncbi:hypothetical protein LSAT2_003789 [Lamellibrachia satsuma]|nr:hypothetical protein LSAT2_003789 [Lamellibrachia satsuma]